MNQDKFLFFEPTIIVGNRRKEEIYLQKPFQDILFSYQMNLLSKNRIIVIRYSFADIGVNSILINWLERNTSNKIIIIDPFLNTDENSFIKPFFQSRLRSQIVLINKYLKDITFDDLNLKEKRMIKTLTIFVIIFLFGSSYKMSSESEYVKSDKIVTQELSISNVDSLDLNLCDKISVELTGLYEVIDTLRSNINETSMSGKYLESEGFIKTTAGIGNWDKGPRMLHLKYERDSCFCDVYKKYYYNEMNSDGSYNMRITERIICNTVMFMDD